MANFTRRPFCLRKNRGTHWIGSGVGPRAVVDGFGHLFSLTGIRMPDRLARTVRKCSCASVGLVTRLRTGWPGNLMLKPYSITEDDVKWSIENIVFSISPAEIRRAVNSVFLLWRLSAFRWKLFPATSLNLMSRNLILIAVHWIHRRGSRLTANWNSCDRCAARHHAKRSDWRVMRLIISNNSPVQKG